MGLQDERVAPKPFCDGKPFTRLLARSDGVRIAAEAIGNQDMTLRLLHQPIATRHQRKGDARPVGTEVQAAKVRLDSRQVGQADGGRFPCLQIQQRDLSLVAVMGHQPVVRRDPVQAQLSTRYPIRHEFCASASLGIIDP